MLAKADRTYSLVLMDAALRCHGMDLAFLLLSDTWVPSEQVCQALPDPLLIEWQMLANEYALSYRPLPAAPVPIARFC